MSSNRIRYAGPGPAWEGGHVVTDPVFYGDDSTRRGTVPARRDTPTDWRSPASPSTRTATFLLIALACASIGVFLAQWMSVYASEVPLSTLLVLWGGFSIAIVAKFTLERPAGLLVFRFSDVVTGVFVGAAMRGLQGILSNSNSIPFPTGAVDRTWAWWIESLVATGIAGPLVEEFFFRGVLLVSMFSLLRQRVGVVGAASAASLGSAGVFILVHSWGAQLDLMASSMFLLLSLALSTLVVATGRIWSAVIAHATYNLTFIFLMIVGVIAR